MPADSDFIPALDEAIGAGVQVFFSAGNYHELAGGAPDGDTPNSIWLHKGRADVMTVGACDGNRRVWSYSSRGPGQHFGDPGTNRKPDVVGLTPADGRILFGGDIVSMPRGWGTSGCCPQVAGLAALILSKRAAGGQGPMPSADLFDLIRSTAAPIDQGWPSCGAGLIDCRAALERV